MAFNLQSKFQNLQRKHEATELDLMHTRLLAASVDAEYDEDDGEGEFIDQLRTGLEDLNQFDLKWYSGFKLGQILKKYKLDTIQFTIFISEDFVIVFDQNCIIAN